MNKSRKLSLINMCANLALIVLEILGVYFLSATGNGFDAWDLRYYTVLTVLVTMLGAALMIWTNIISFIKKKDCTPRLFYSIRFLSAVMSLITLITVAAVLAPSQGLELVFSLESGAIFMHFVCPIISVFQFVFLEIEPKGKFKKTLEPFIATVVYALVILIIMFVRIGTIGGTEGLDAAAEFAPYFFFLITDGLATTAKAMKNLGAAANAGVAVAVIVAAYGISALLWLLNRISHNIIIGEVYQVAAPKKAVSTKKTTTTAKKGNAFTNYMKKKVAFTGDESSSSGQVYHISYHDRRLKTWKVKTENAGRALKVFPTQKEAIDFANQCVKKNGGSIRIHSMVGRIRKEW